MEIFSARLKFIRENKNLSQEQVATHMGISLQTYDDVESGKSEPDLNALSKIPSILEESVDFFIGVTHLDSTIKMCKEECMRSLLGVISNKSKFEKNHTEDSAEKIIFFEKKLVDDNIKLFDYFYTIPFMPKEELKDIEEEIIRSAHHFQSIV
ncbi:helix-turn-helix domain-containing protein [Paenibacillus silvae]|nr:helix-turn-helix transcriptional regulator [Paenibacillus silvae]